MFSSSHIPFLILFFYLQIPLKSGFVSFGGNIKEDNNLFSAGFLSKHVVILLKNLWQSFCLGSFKHFSNFSMGALHSIGLPSSEFEFGIIDHSPFSRNVFQAQFR
jgi:hypothetical protein